MKIIKIIQTFLAVMLLPVLLIGQSHNHSWCGTTELDLLTDRTKANKQRLAEQGVTVRSGVKYIPLKFHLIAKDDGNGRVSERQVLNQMCALNEFYADNNAGVQFYLSGDFIYHDNSTFYFLPSNDGILVPEKVNNAVNIFVVSTIEEIGGISPAGYYSPSDDMLVMLKNQIGSTSLTLQHEIGHFFSLPHPFNGWDFDAWDPDIHGNPVGQFSPDGTRTEKQDGSNCNIAGDFICDTPPDYRFSGGCNYSGGAMDPDGVLVDPDETNVMSYFSDNCVDYITAEQIALVNMDFDNRPPLQNNYFPEAISLDEAPQLMTPANESNQAGNGFIAFTWSAVPGATHYYFELARSQDFTFDVTRQIHSGTSTFMGNLLEDKNYYWRVKAFNAYATCGPLAQFNTFNTDVLSGTNTIEAIDKWQIEPNPVVGNNQVNISVQSVSGFDATIELVSITGQTLRIVSNQFTAGENTIQLDTQGLAAGMYMVTINSGNASTNKKLVIGR